MKPKVYFAGKMHRAPFFRHLRNECQEYLTVVSSWIDHDPKLETEGTPESFRGHWACDDAEIKSCDAIIVYADWNDELKGALIEVGMGIAYGKRVIITNDSKSYGTWQHHPAIEHIPGIWGAIEILVDKE